MTAWSLPLHDRAEWRPEQRDTPSSATGELTPGVIVVYDRKPYRIDSVTLVIVDGVPRSIEMLASDLLGLDIDQSDDLFASENTLDDLRRIVRELTGQECPR